MSSNTTTKQLKGHWVLAKMGKKVLRPGGKELTDTLITHLAINSNDDVVEFAPGLGLTAKMTLNFNPNSYTGIELNEEACHFALKRLKQSKYFGNHCQMVVGNANATHLVSQSYSKVYGEAMLTMQSNKQKAQIIAEAYRLLKSGGLYGIHELGLKDNDISEALKKQIQKNLSKTINVNARPLTLNEWAKLGKDQGFTVVKTATNDMALLEPRRLLEDEGLSGLFKIGLNVLTHPKERQHITAMRQVFQKYRHHLNAVSLVFEK